MYGCGHLISCLHFSVAREAVELWSTVSVSPALGRVGQIVEGVKSRLRFHEIITVVR